MQSEPSSRSNFPAFFRINSTFASPPLLYFPTPVSTRAVPMADLRLRSQSSSPIPIKPITEKVADSDSVAPIQPPRTHLLIRLLCFTSAILSIYSVAIVGGRRRAPLPDAYALCSHSGANIYTVDPNYPRAQCMVVQGSYIVDVGAIGM
jgi:hypothetical protein